MGPRVTSFIGAIVVVSIGIGSAAQAVLVRVAGVQDKGTVCALSSRAIGPPDSEAVPSSAVQALRRLVFIENRGQLDERARFVARRSGMSTYFTKNGFVLQLVAREAKDSSLGNLRPEASPAEDGCLQGASVFFTFEGASSEVVLEGSDAIPGRYNYFRGNDPSKWCTNVLGYTSVHYRGLYPGIDMVMRERDGRLEYDLLLAPEADPAQIVVRCEGTGPLRVRDDGSLVLDTAAGRLEQPPTTTFQLDGTGAREPVACTYRLLGNDRFSFDVTSRAREKPLVIDPGLVYSTFLGGSLDDEAYVIAVNAAGAVIVAGATSSTDFPGTSGAYDPSLNGLQDVFVTKLSPDGSSLVYSTFLGGGGADIGLGLTLDANGAAVVAGSTASSDFPVTPGSYSTTYHGSNTYYGGDAFVTKLSADGSSLVYSTFLGGGGIDECYGIEIDGAGAALVAGFTSSSDFPVSAGAFDTTFGGSSYHDGGDGFVAKLSADGSSLVYSTFLGGSEDDRMNSISADADGTAFVTGGTSSVDFPVTPGAFDTTYSGYGSEAVVAKLSANGSTLLYSTFLGGEADDMGNDIAIDSAGAAYVTGTTSSTDFPTTPGAYDTTLNTYQDVFVTKLSSDGRSLVYSTLLGGSGMLEQGRSIALDAAGAAFVAGVTYSTDFPTTPGAYDTTYGGGFGDGFVAKFSTDGRSLVYSTFLGGGLTGNGYGDDFVNSIAVDATDAAFVTGLTESGDFPTTPGAYATTYSGVMDAFVAKLTFACGAGSWTNYGSGWPGTNGVPSFTSNGVPKLCNTLTVDVGNSLGADTVALLMVGFQATDQPTALGGHRLVMPTVAFLLTVPASGLAPSGVLPCDESLCGLAVCTQVLELDAGASRGVSFTAGLLLVLGV